MDFLNHLLDAPLANILILAGLLFLGVAAVGKVVGKIEPDKTGRIVSGLLGIALLTGGVVAHILSDSKKNSGKAEQSDPIIHVFSVTPTHVIQGGKVKITWEVLNADDVELDPLGQVMLSGSITDEPQKTTIYRLSATNKSGGKQGTVQQVFVEAHAAAGVRPENSATPAAVTPPVIATATATPSLRAAETVNTPSPVPNFAGTWKMIEQTRNGAQQQIPTGKPPLTITQNGNVVRIGSNQLSIASDGTITQKFFFAQGYQDGHPQARRVETENGAAMVQTIRWSVQGPTLIMETTYDWKAPLLAHLPSTEHVWAKYLRASTNPSGR